MPRRSLCGISVCKAPLNVGVSFVRAHQKEIN